MRDVIGSIFQIFVGGPLMGDDTSNPRRPFIYLAGIVSFGLSTCGLAGYPGVYTVRTC